MFAALPALAIAAACAVDGMPDATEGAQLFASNCTGCHGSDAGGGVVLADGRKTPDLTTIAARNGGRFPRAAVLSQIDGYGQDRTGLAEMPEYGSLLEGELVPVDVDGTLTPTPRPLAALLAYLESIQTE
ncbi:cytochrome c [Pukyongiella litopenaei]|uniref:Cytochrome c n=2 Tax=Pukyongiella litopenaei TaxID=2605946 RepID=A0A2S0MVP1_9RHOB|nr:cytochrome c [Pukyongiella litopenaei]